MDLTQVLEVGRDLFYTALLLAMPALVISLAVGLVMSVLQTITSIQEQTLAFVPRLVAVGLVLVWTMPLLLRVGVHFTMRMLERAAEVGR
jgi:flagellar biosynthetic protein FliQ